MAYSSQESHIGPAYSKSNFLELGQCAYGNMQLG